MERWKAVFENKIPKDEYDVLLQNGEEKGLVIKLISSKSNVVVNFGVVSAFRMLDEGIALSGLFNDEQVEHYHHTGFCNVIYRITDGEFDKFIQPISGGLYEYLELKHYVIISRNYIIEVITEGEPDIQVLVN